MGTLPPIAVGDTLGTVCPRVSSSIAAWSVPSVAWARGDVGDLPITPGWSLFESDEEGPFHANAQLALYRLAGRGFRQIHSHRINIRRPRPDRRGAKGHSERAERTEDVSTG